MEFKVGDWVEVSQQCSGAIVGVAYEVVDRDGRLTLKTETFPDLACHCQERWSIAKPKQSIKMKITNAFKKFLAPDLQAQVKAGFRDEGLNLTSAGQNAAIEALLDATPAAQTAFTAAAEATTAEQEK